MNNKIIQLKLFAGVLILLMTQLGWCAQGKFVPKDNKVLLIIGQDNDSINGYTSSGLFPEPGGVTNYSTPFHPADLGGMNAHGILQNFEYGSGPMNFSTAMKENPNSALSIGLFISGNSPYDRNRNLTATDALNEIVNGQHDVNLIQLADFAKSVAPRPIFLRIGYEFDGPWNAYDPVQYIQAYKHIVNLMRNQNVTNMAYVWQSATWWQNPLGNFQKWYPGDEYVDWVGISFFYLTDLPDFNNKARFDEMLNFARSKNKPVMMAEASAQYYDFDEGNRYNDQGQVVEQLGVAGVWTEFFENQLLSYLNANTDVIRSVAWINADWRNQPQWVCCDSGFWGDTRIEAAPFIAEQWAKEVAKTRWLHGGPNLLNDLGI